MPFLTLRSASVTSEDSMPMAARSRVMIPRSCECSDEIFSGTSSGSHSKEPTDPAATTSRPRFE